MTIRNERTAAIAGILAGRVGVASPRVLVVGCGSGQEAAVLAQALNAKVIGIDIVENFHREASEICRLQYGDATNLDFDDASFDVVFSYHALEHIPNYSRALSEMHRALKPNGIYCIGTPNRSRLVGYVGGDSTLAQKIFWNYLDLIARLTGRFRNECGAHAGYTASELRTILLEHFSTTEDVSTEYYRRLYVNHLGAINAVVGAGLGRFIFPSVYFAGTR